MTTMLFNDDVRLNRLDNLTRRIRRPQLLHEFAHRDSEFEMD